MVESCSVLDKIWTPTRLAILRKCRSAIQPDRDTTCDVSTLQSRTTLAAGSYLIAVSGLAYRLSIVLGLLQGTERVDSKKHFSK